MQGPFPDSPTLCTQPNALPSVRNCYSYTYPTLPTHIPGRPTPLLHSEAIYLSRFPCYVAHPTLLLLVPITHSKSTECSVHYRAPATKAGLLLYAAQSPRMPSASVHVISDVTTETMTSLQALIRPHCCYHVLPP